MSPVEYSGTQNKTCKIRHINENTMPASYPSEPIPENDMDSVKHNPYPTFMADKSIKNIDTYLTDYQSNKQIADIQMAGELQVATPKIKTTDPFNSKVYERIVLTEL